MDEPKNEFTHEDVINGCKHYFILKKKLKQMTVFYVNTMPDVTYSHASGEMCVVIFQILYGDFCKIPKEEPGNFILFTINSFECVFE